jgi:hypothetical protein
MFRSRILLSVVVVLCLMLIMGVVGVAAQGAGAQAGDNPDSSHGKSLALVQPTVPDTSDGIALLIYLPLIEKQNCSNLIVNGGFEVNFAWELPATEYTAAYSTDNFYTGLRSLRTGIVKSSHNRYSYSSARQQVSIVEGATVTLTSRLWRISGEPDATHSLQKPDGWLGMNLAGGIFPDDLELTSGDVQYILILNKNQVWIDTLLWQRKDAHEWTNKVYDLSKYAGKTIYLQFGTYNNGYGGVTSMYVDDVSLDVCK